MNRGIPESVINEIRERVSISEVVGRYISLKKRGANHKGLCPFHSEKTPSFVVSDQKRIYHCFGCGETGTVYSIVMKMEGATFPEAVRQLAEQVGVEVPEDSYYHGGRYDEAERRRQLAYDINIASAEFFHSLLMHSEEGGGARMYLKGRHIDSKLAETFFLGYGGQRWDSLVQHLTSGGYDLDVAQAIGIIAKKQSSSDYYCPLRDRIIFPIYDTRDRVIGFGGRVMDAREPKYINSFNSLIFDKSESLYGINIAKLPMRRKGRVMLTEGYLDVVALHKHGFDNAVATLGTALTERHVRRLKTYTGNVLTLFDSDRAGQEATKRGLKMFLRAGVEASVVVLPPGEDADSVLRRHPKCFLEEKLGTAVPLLDFLVSAPTSSDSSGSSLASPHRRAILVDEILEVVCEIPNPIERQFALQELAKKFDLRLDLLQSELAKKTPPRVRGVRPTIGAAATKARGNSEAVGSGTQKGGRLHDGQDSRNTELLSKSSGGLSREEGFVLGLMLHHPTLFFESVNVSQLAGYFGRECDRALILKLAEDFLHQRGAFHQKPGDGAGFGETTCFDSVDFSVLIDSFGDADDVDLKGLFAKVAVEAERYGEALPAKEVGKMIEDSIHALERRWQRRRQHQLSRELSEALENENEDGVKAVLEQKNKLLKREAFHLRQL